VFEVSFHLPQLTGWLQLLHVHFSKGILERRWERREEGREKGRRGILLCKAWFCVVFKT